MTPIRVLTSPLVRRTVNVVPKLVEHKAAPAAKAWRGVALASCWRRNESPIGMLMPVMATTEERKRFAFSDENDSESPPVRY